MPHRTFTTNKTAIIGTGLLGGSLGLAIRGICPDAEVVGVNRSEAGRRAARRAGCVTATSSSIATAVAGADLVVLATPVGAFETIFHSLVGKLAEGALVTDVGSTKRDVVRLGESILGRGGPFVGSHPMAGKERKGAAFAEADLLVGAPCLLTPTSHTPKALLNRAKTLWQAVGMRPMEFPPAEHDRVVARISHLPHIISSLLMALPRDEDLPASSSGFRDMTRLAGGDPEMWRDIMLTNRDAILNTIDRFDTQLAKLRTVIEAGQPKPIEQFLAKEQQRRRTLPDG
ncbi:MAG: prephenate dehydrogenase/arogenate dehydrogenase family protein [Phycisphaerales bacterium]|nr:prephenate dehydrogenase/arogenate dehydrogenase family protein [Phycisphaerales bacterium]MBT7171948.1 prephenate dehydrogenase/arogenate dehydrogenase family protein [Phycisphaerales bacterium]